MYEPYDRKPCTFAHAHRLAEAVDLDLAAASWGPTVENYLGRVTKASILAAVREAKGQQAARQIEHLKKAEMAEQAQDLLAGSGWLPEPLRTPGRVNARPLLTLVSDEQCTQSCEGEDTAENGGETAMAKSAVPLDDGFAAAADHETVGE